MNTADPTPRLQKALSAVRAAVRSAHPYIVGGPEKPAAKLNQNESPFDLPEDLKRELLETFFAIPFNRYSTEQPERLRDALAEKLGVTPGQVIVGNGSNELTYTLGQCFVEKGTPVVLPRPMFSLYEKVVHLCDGRLIPIAPRASLQFDADAILDAVTRVQPALTVLTTPNNPTGLEMEQDAIRAIVEAAEGVVVVDEAYSEFSDRPSAVQLIDTYPNVMVLRTFSKAMGLAGLRIGYLVAHEQLATEVMKARLPFMVDRLAEHTALALLDRPGLVAERAQTLRQAARTLQQDLQARDGVEVVTTDVNFFLFRTALPAATIVQELGARGVQVRSMAGYPELPRYVRVSAGTITENRQFLAALDSLFSTVALKA